MKDFSWNYFVNTGQIDAYLLYKDFESFNQQKEVETNNKSNSND